jgi:hypothetical protein
MRMRVHGKSAVGGVGGVGLFIYQQVKKINGVGSGVGFSKLA